MDNTSRHKRNIRTNTWAGHTARQLCSRQDEPQYKTVVDRLRGYAFMIIKKVLLTMIFPWSQRPDTSDSNTPCRCQAIGSAVQVFRVRRLSRSLLFRSVVRVRVSLPGCAEGREVWICRQCGQLFARMNIVFDKTREDVIVRAPQNKWQTWDWQLLADNADDCRWRGSGVDKRYVL